jgi:hypothetical protein
LVLAKAKFKGETEAMNIVNILLAIGIIGFAVVLALLTEGLFLPASLPMTVYALQMVGVVPK